MRTISNVLGDVRPGLAETYLAHCCLRNAVVVGDVPLPFGGCANCQNILLGELCAARLLSTNKSRRILLRIVGFAADWRVDASPLGVHVSGVCRRIAKEQVDWVDTSGVVAAVADQHPARDGPEVQEPRNAMRSLGLTVVAEAAVALLGDAAEPLPAVAVGIAFRQESTECGHALIIARRTHPKPRPAVPW